MKKLLPLLLALSFVTGANAQLQQNAWPKSHSDLANTSLSTASGVLDYIKWHYLLPVEKTFVPSLSVDQNNVIYLGATDGFARAIRGDTGVVKWTAPTGSTSYSTPAIDQTGTVYLGTDEGFLFALDSSTGDLIWKMQPSSVPGNAVGSPSIGSNGIVYVECSDGNLYAINPVTASVSWKFSLGSDATPFAANNTPAIGSDGTIYAAGGNEIAAISSGGSSLWKYLSGTGSAVTSPMIGVNGNIYFGSSTGLVNAITKNGALLWNYQSGVDGILATPVLGPNEMVYIGSMDGTVYAFDPLTGGVIWSFLGAAGVDATPVVAGDGTVYVPTVNLTMYALDGSTGYAKWSFQSDSNCLGLAIGPDGSLYLPTGTGSLYAFPSGVIPESLEFDPSPVIGGSPSTGTINLNKPAIFDLTFVLSSDTGGVVVPGSVIVPAGRASASFAVTTPFVVKQFQATITAMADGYTVSGGLTLSPLLVSNLTLNPASIAGGDNVTGTVTLNSAAPPGGATISLSGNNTAIIVPGVVNVSGGQTAATFQIKTVPVTKTQYAAVTAQLNGASTQLAYLTVNPSQLSSLVFAPSTVGGGSSSTGTVILTGPAPTGGIEILLSNSNSSAGIPPSLPIAAGQSSAMFAVHTAEVTKETVAVIVATLGSITRAASLTIVPPQIESISLSPSSVAGGRSVKGTVYLTGDANKSGLSVKLKSSVKGVTVPAAVAVGSGKSSATFTVTTIAVSSLTKATITGTTGTVSATANLTVNQPTLVSLSVSPTSVKGGKTATGTVKISSVAPTGGMVIQLTSSVSGVTVPTKVTVPAGRISVMFTIKTIKVTGKTSATISSSAAGVSIPTTLTVT